MIGFIEVLLVYPDFEDFLHSFSNITCIIIQFQSLIETQQSFRNITHFEISQTTIEMCLTTGVVVFEMEL